MDLYTSAPTTTYSIPGLDEIFNHFRYVFFCVFKTKTNLIAKQQFTNYLITCIS